MLATKLADDGCNPLASIEALELEISELEERLRDCGHDPKAVRCVGMTQLYDDDDCTGISE